MPNNKYDSNNQTQPNSHKNMYKTPTQTYTHLHTHVPFAVVL